MLSGPSPAIAAHEISEAGTTRVAQGITGPPGRCSGCAPGQRPIGSADKTLGLSQDAARLRVVERRYAHQGDLELAIHIEQGIAPRIGDTCYVVSPNG